MTKLFRYILLLNLLLLIKVQSYSQCGSAFPYSSNNGQFSVSEIRGCAGMTVDICISEPTCDCVNSCSCDIIFGDGIGNDVFSYTYQTPGSYRLEIIFPNPTPSDFIDIVITDNTAPDFEIFSCANNTARVNIEDSQYDTYSIDYGDGTNTVVPVGSPNDQHTYASSGTRSVSVQGIDINGLDNCPVASTDFTPLNTLPALTIQQLKVLDDTSLELLYTPEENILYRLEVQVNGTGNFNFIKNVNITSSPDTLTNLDLVNNFYCFRIGSVDPCSNGAVYSNTICSISTALEIQNANNALNWSTANPSEDFRLARQVENENGSTTSNPFLTFNPNQRSYDDADISCNTQYCYFFEANYNGGLSISNTVCGIAISSNLPDSVADLSIRINDGESLLDWPDDMAVIDNYEVQSSGFFLGKTEESSFTDFISNRNLENACYTIITTDDCGNVNSTTDICSIFLQGSIAKDNAVTLNWNEYTGYQNGVSTYRIEKFYNDITAGTSEQITTSFEETDNNPNEQVINYQITAVPTTSTLDNSQSNTITLIKPNNIYYPTAFTPDNNGTNDVFTVNGRFLAEYQMQVFNRWGEMIYSTESPENGWDGTLNGQPQHEGTYLFNLEAIDLAGREIQENGSFVLIRR